jgi:hypothetical protein
VLHRGKKAFSLALHPDKAKVLKDRCVFAQAAGALVPNWGECWEHQQLQDTVLQAQDWLFRVLNSQ